MQFNVLPGGKWLLFEEWPNMSNVDQALFPRQSRQHCPKSTLRTTASTPVEFLCTKCHQIVSTLAPSNVKLQIEILNLQGLILQRCPSLCSVTITSLLLFWSLHNIQNPSTPVNSDQGYLQLFSPNITLWSNAIKLLVTLWQDQVSQLCSCS